MNLAKFYTIFSCFDPDLFLDELNALSILFNVIQ